MKFLAILMIIITNSLIVFCMVSDTKDRFEEVKEEYEKSINGQVVDFKEGRNGYIRYNEEDR